MWYLSPIWFQKRFKLAILWDRYYNSHLPIKEMEDSKEDSLDSLGSRPLRFMRLTPHSGKTSAPESLWWPHSRWEGTYKDSLRGTARDSSSSYTWNRGARSHHGGRTSRWENAGSRRRPGECIRKQASVSERESCTPAPPKAPPSQCVLTQTLQIHRERWLHTLK